MIELKSFPRDNTDVDASDFGRYLGTRKRGVYSADDNLRVVANNDMTITVKKGVAWNEIGEQWGIAIGLQADDVLDVDLSDGVLNRIDAVVLRSDTILNKDYIYIEKGVLANSPTAPNPVRNSSYQDLILGYLNIRAGLSFITQNDIIDKRLDEAVCGVMRDGVNGIPTADLVRQFQDQLAEMDVATSGKFQEYDNTIADKVAELDSAIDNRMVAQVRPCVIPVSAWVQEGNYYYANINVTNVTATSNLVISYSPAMSAQLELALGVAGFKCVEQGNGTIKFRVTTIADITEFSPQVLEIF